MMEYESNKIPRSTRVRPLPPPARNVWLWLASKGVWMVLGLMAFYLLMVALSFGVGVGGHLGFLSPALALIALTSIDAFVTGRRRSHARRMMHYVHQAVRLNLPLPEMLHAAELSERGRMRKRLGKLRQRLQEGLPLGRAIELAAPGVRRRDVAAVEAGEHLGRLPEALDRVVSGGTAADEQAQAASAATRLHLRWYPIVMLVFVGGAISLFLIFVMPKFEALFQDFKLQLPAVTRAVVSFWAGPGGVLFTVLPLVLLVWYCGRTLARAVAPRWAAAGSGLHVWDRIAWGLPVVRGIVRSRGLADACFVAADALAAGATLPRALAEAAGVPDNSVLRGRITKWGDAIAAGADPGDAARSVGLPELVVGMVSTGVASGQLSDVFRFLARYYDARASRLATLLEGAAIPAMSLVFGVIVGAIVLSVFLPMLDLIEAVAKGGFR